MRTQIVPAKDMIDATRLVIIKPDNCPAVKLICFKWKCVSASIPLSLYPWTSLGKKGDAIVRQKKREKERRGEEKGKRKEQKKNLNQWCIIIKDSIVIWPVPPNKMSTQNWQRILKLVSKRLKSHTLVPLLFYSCTDGTLKTTRVLFRHWWNGKKNKLVSICGDTLSLVYIVPIYLFIALCCQFSWLGCWHIKGLWY